MKGGEKLLGLEDVKVTELLELGWTIEEVELVETFSVEDAGL